MDTVTAASTQEEEDGNSSTIIQPQQSVPVPVDYAYAMLDPSERYVFDVNPSRIYRDNSSMFVAHLVNDAAAALAEVVPMRRRRWTLTKRFERQSLIWT
jgi:hypothetical protein